MGRSFIIIFLLAAFVENSCIQNDNKRENYRLNIWIEDILSASEFDALAGIPSDYRGATYIKIKVNNIYNDTLFIWGQEPEGKMHVGSYLPAVIEYSYYDSLENKRQHHIGSGDDWSAKPIVLLPDTSHDFIFFNMSDFRTDSIIYRFRYYLDTLTDADPCYILTTYLFENEEVVANVGCIDTCAPKSNPSPGN